MRHKLTVAKLREELAQARSNPDPVYGLSSGISSLDRRTGGLHAGEMTILAGRPGHGKTTLAAQMAYDIAFRAQQEDKPGHVLYFSAEMPAHRILARELARQTGISIPRQRSGEYTEQEAEILWETLAGLEDLPLEIDDHAGIDVETIKETVRAHQNQAGILALFVDHLQLAVQAKAGWSQYQAVTQCVHEMRKLRDLINAPVVVLSQLRRPDSGGEHQRPDATDLRDSGAIEEAANNVYLLYNPSPMDEDDQGPRAAELLIRKARDGWTGTIHLQFDPERVCFLDPIPKPPRLEFRLQEDVLNV